MQIILADPVIYDEYRTGRRDDGDAVQSFPHNQSSINAGRIGENCALHLRSIPTVALHPAREAAAYIFHRMPLRPMEQSRIPSTNPTAIKTGPVVMRRFVSWPRFM